MEAKRSVTIREAVDALRTHHGLEAYEQAVKKIEKARAARKHDEERFWQAVAKIIDLEPQ